MFGCHPMLRSSRSVFIHFVFRHLTQFLLFSVLNSIIFFFQEVKLVKFFRVFYQKACGKLYSQVFTIQLKTVTYIDYETLPKVQRPARVRLFSWLKKASLGRLMIGSNHQRQQPILHPVIFDANELYFDRTWRLRRSRQCSLFSKCPTNQQQ